MIAIKPAIKQLLVEDEAVAALVEGRVHFDVIPTRDSLPGPTLVLTTWPIQVLQGSEGRTGLEAHAVQVDAYATDPLTPDEVMEVAAEALSPTPPKPHRRTVAGVEIQAVRETPAGGAPTYEADTRLYRRSLDFKVHAARAAA